MRKQEWKASLVPIFVTATASFALLSTPPALARAATTSSAPIAAESTAPDVCNRSWHRGRSTQVEVVTNGTPQTIGDTGWTDLACGTVIV